MSFLQRLKRLVSSNANAVVDNLEDENKMVDQIIRELSEKQQDAIEGYAKVKAIALKHRASEATNKELANEWEKKTNDLLNLVECNGIEKEKGEKLANEAAQTYEEYVKKAEGFAKLAVKEESDLKKLDVKIKEIKKTIEEAKGKAEMIKAKSATADAEVSINKTLSSVDIDGLKATMARMEEKASAKEFEAEAYSDLDVDTMTTKDEIEEALSSSSSALDKFKANRKK